jgi:hypothetical protein
VFWKKTFCQTGNSQFHATKGFGLFAYFDPFFGWGLMIQKSRKQSKFEGLLDLSKLVVNIGKMLKLK